MAKYLFHLKRGLYNSWECCSFVMSKQCYFAIFVKSEMRFPFAFALTFGYICISMIQKSKRKKYV